METAKLYAAGAFTVGLVLTLFLAAYLTPRAWWRRPNVCALLIMVVGAWGFGSLILAAVKGHDASAANSVASIDSNDNPKQDKLATARALSAAAAAREASAKAAGPIAGQPFQVHRTLNLRTAAGVHATRLITVPAGATVTPTGARSGDWWQIKTSVAGRENTGWVSSLWLRRSGE